MLLQTQQLPSVRKVKEQLTVNRQNPVDPSPDVSAAGPAAQTKATDAAPVSESLRPGRTPRGPGLDDNPNVRGAGAFTFKEVE
ncbi:hypothetical protein FM102_01480 [Corynebacterium glutamicum]|uniref:hypothetical protein n=1 Tax=Corynebacterium glutamicum TaxID=1718 RepID=UPI00097E9444|nr:hypothetical protein [Corynebacterium glutamicum]SJM45350.1 hypothetical protein FM102_01480 [Corynebacterium glutamicum]